MCRFRGSFSKTKPCGTSATTRRYSMRCCWTDQHFPAERLRRAGRHDSAVLHLGTGANQTPPQPSERHANLPGVGVQRLDCSAQAGLGQARAHYAELPSGCKANSAKREWRNIARIKVENKVFFAPQSARKHRGISFPITPQKSVSMRLQKR